MRFIFIVNSVFVVESFKNRFLLISIQKTWTDGSPELGLSSNRTWASKPFFFSLHKFLSKLQTPRFIIISSMLGFMTNLRWSAWWISNEERHVCIHPGFLHHKEAVSMMPHQQVHIVCLSMVRPNRLRTHLCEPEQLYKLYCYEPIGPIHQAYWYTLGALSYLCSRNVENLENLLDFRTACRPIESDGKITAATLTIYALYSMVWKYSRDIVPIR